jgi:hypothetical protein
VRCARCALGRAAVALALLALVLIAIGGRGAEAAAQAVPGTYPVQVSQSTFTDSYRSTPARDGVAAQPTRTIHEVIYAPSGPEGQLPTVLFAPGWDDQSSAYDPLLRTIASAGWLVIGVDSPGSSSWFPGTPYYTTAGRDIPNDVIDLSAALSNVEGGPLGSRVDRAEVAAVGHSDGGDVVTTLALDDEFTSSRFSAYVVLSGDVDTTAAPGTFSAINNGPIMAMVGTADEYGNYTPGADGGGTESVYRTAGQPRFMVTIAGATHLSAYTGTGVQADDTRQSVVDFLEAAETHDPAARSALTADLSTDGLSVSGDPGNAWDLSGSTAGMAVTADAGGYWVADADGVVRAFGDAPWLGRVSDPAAPIVAAASTSDGGGYWLVAADGEVWAFGDAVGHGDLQGTALAAPIVAMAADPATGGYWLLGADGGVFSFDAPFYGSTGSIRLARPAVGMEATPDGGGYRFVASDGGIFDYGNASFQGSTGNLRLAAPVVGMADDAATGGYWLDAADGGIFSFDAPFFGSAGNVQLQAPCVGMTAVPGGGGYRFIAADGGVFDFGDAVYEGSAS